RLLEPDLLPLGAVRAPVEHGVQPPGLLDQLARRRALRAQRALVDRGARIALDVDELAVARIDELAAADRPVGADRLGDLQPCDPRARLAGVARDRVRAESPVGGATHDRKLAQPLELAGSVRVAHSGGRATHLRARGTPGRRSGTRR